jgi:hypothetical protein
MKNLSLSTIAFAGFITGPAIATDLVAPFIAFDGSGRVVGWNVSVSRVTPNGCSA